MALKQPNRSERFGCEWFGCFKFCRPSWSLAIAVLQRKKTTNFMLQLVCLTAIDELQSPFSYAKKTLPSDINPFFHSTRPGPTKLPVYRGYLNHRTYPRISHLHVCHAARVKPTNAQHRRDTIKLSYFSPSIPLAFPGALHITNTKKSPPASLAAFTIISRVQKTSIGLNHSRYAKYVIPSSKNYLVTLREGGWPFSSQFPPITMLRAASSH